MSRWPHDDTASLTSFYGPPNTPSNMVLVVPPWPLKYEGKPCRGVRIHRKCAASLKAVFDDIAQQVGHDWSKLPPGATNFSGSFNPRPVRGASRPSCHAFGAAVDMDAANNTMNRHGGKGTMSPIVVDAFKRQGWYWGADFHSRQDPMHFQAAHESSRVAELIGDLSPISQAFADETPPHEEGDTMADEANKPQATIEDAPAEDNLQGNIATAAIQELPKSLVKSKIGWAQTLLAFFGIGTVGSHTDMSFFEKAWAFITSPGFVLMLMLICIGLTLYWRWRDHGRGGII